MKQPDIQSVRQFWDKAPLWTGESTYRTGSKEFFAEHSQTMIEDCFAGKLDPRLFPDAAHADHVLDLGCGPGFWSVELAKRGCTHITAADLSQTALDLAAKRLELFDVKATLTLQNAEKLSFADETFQHVNCQGVIHHTPDTAACVREIARVLKPGGTACISVYYKNIFLRLWPGIRWMGQLLSQFGAGLKGRGREEIFKTQDVNEIVRLYDGKDNPIGRSYSRLEYVALLKPYFEINRLYFHFFPARAFPFPIPKFLHRFLDRCFGFMIFASLKKAPL